MSDLIDEGLPFPSSLHSHIASCPECAAFAEIWQDQGHPLTGALPAAGTDLEQRILRLPQAHAARPTSVIHVLSGIAAAILLLVASWWFTRQGEELPALPAIVQMDEKDAELEIATLRTDFDNALVSLAEPLSVFNILAPP